MFSLAILPPPPAQGVGINMAFEGLDRKILDYTVRGLCEEQDRRGPRPEPVVASLLVTNASLPPRREYHPKQPSRKEVEVGTQLSVIIERTIS